MLFVFLCGPAINWQFDLDLNPQFSKDSFDWLKKPGWKTVECLAFAASGLVQVQSSVASNCVSAVSLRPSVPAEAGSAGRAGSRRK